MPAADNIYWHCKFPNATPSSSLLSSADAASSRRRWVQASHTYVTSAALPPKPQQRTAASERWPGSTYGRSKRRWELYLGVHPHHDLKGTFFHSGSMLLGSPWLSTALPSELHSASQASGCEDASNFTPHVRLHALILLPMQATADAALFVDCCRSHAAARCQ